MIAAMETSSKLNASDEISALGELYGLENYEVQRSIESALQKTIGREVFIYENEANNIEIKRINKNGTSSTVTLKSYKKSRRELQRELQQKANQKHKEKIATIFSKHKMVEGVIIDKTSNGYFVATRGEKAFFAKSESHSLESARGLYEVGNKINFAVLKIVGSKVFLTRKSLEIHKTTVLELTGRYLQMKYFEHKGLIIIYCPSPFLNEVQKEMIRASLPCRVIFKKEKNEGIK